MASLEPEDNTIIVDSSRSPYSLQSYAIRASQIDYSVIDPALFNPSFTVSATLPTEPEASLNDPVRSIEASQAQNKRTEIRWTLLMHETF
jgi:hypothetical protein